MIKRKQIAFNITDPKQKEMFEYIEKMTNFSAYGKMLIFNDLHGIKSSNQQQVQIVDDDIDFLKQLI